MPNLQLDCRMEIRQRSKQEELDRRKVIKVMMFVMMVWLIRLIMVVEATALKIGFGPPTVNLWDDWF